MNEELKEQLKGLGMLPLHLDSERRDQYRAQGINPATVEIHNDPQRAPSSQFEVELRRIVLEDARGL